MKGRGPCQHGQPAAADSPTAGPARPGIPRIRALLSRAYLVKLQRAILEAWDTAPTAAGAG
jgi:hypothetical protein